MIGSERSHSMEKDPVCGMDVDPKTARQRADYHGKAYYFCAPGCKKAFEAEPEKYLRPEHKPSM
jgi:Cu+-exporting ATPase